MNFNNDKEVVEFVAGVKEAHKLVHTYITARVGRDTCYYEGVQWLALKDLRTLTTSAGALYPLRAVGSIGGGGKIRISDNQSAKFAQRVIAATRPNAFEFDVKPPSHRMKPEDAYRASVAAKVLSIEADHARMVSKAQQANKTRWITGSAILGLASISVPREINLNGKAVTVEDRVLRAFVDDATHLITDPANMSENLLDHEYVIWSDVITLNKARALYGIKIDPDDAKTIGELTSEYQELYNISGGRLYQHYKQYSKTKGIRIYQAHFADKSRPGFFPVMLVMYEDPDKGLLLTKQSRERRETPYGGSGLPFVNITGFPASAGILGFSAIAAMIDSQDKHNLIQTYLYRHLLTCSSVQWWVDKRSTGTRDGSISSTFINGVGQVNYFTGGTRNDNIQPPFPMKPPDPSSLYATMDEALKGDMLQKAHRADVNLGVGKSHRTAQGDLLLVEQADLVMQTKADDDKQAYSTYMLMTLGTVCKALQSYAPNVAIQLQENGLDDNGIETLLGMDPHNPQVEIVIRDSTVRNRSLQQREVELNNAVATQAITPTELRVQKARMNAPILDIDREILEWAEGVAISITRGGEYTVLPQLSQQRWEILRGEMERMIASPDVPPDRKAALSQAMLAQEQQMASEMVNNPMMQAQMQLAQATQPQPQGGEGQQQPASIAEAMAAVGIPL